MPSKAEIEWRVKAIIRRQAQGATNSEIQQWACQEWGISKRQSLKYFDKAKDHLDDFFTRPIEVQYAELWLKYNYIYEQVVSTGEFKLAERVMAEKNKLLVQYQKYLNSNPVLAQKVGDISLNLLEQVFRIIAKELKSGKAS